jgi:alcohol dehydrogenase (NADP+)
LHQFNPVFANPSCSRRQFAGSLIGSPNEIEEMLQVASKNSIGATVQVWPIEKVNDAIEDFRKGNPRYRNVLLLK